MWYYLVKIDNQLYQDGKEVDNFIVMGEIVDIVIKGVNQVWVKIGG